ncbi:MAG: phosphatidylethanolamine-binding family protein [Rhodospirillales bacterium]|nr:phosphatidylethanolamine-binding family protein [Rhodospirillales bacterium]
MSQVSLDKFAVVVALAASCSIATAGSGAAAVMTKYFDLSSPAFRDGAMLPKKFAGANPANKNCDGQNVSPALKWSNVPNGTKSFAIVFQDTTGRAPLGVVHWLAYDIPATKAGLKEGEASAPSSEFKVGKSTVNQPAYFGPCPPIGDKPHPYIFTLIATDLAPGTLNAGMTREELAAALNGHILGATGLISRYGH